MKTLSFGDKLAFANLYFSFMFSMITKKKKKKKQLSK